jgi:hypothetical protein
VFVLRGRPFLYGSHFLEVGCYPLRWHNISKILYFLLKKSWHFSRRAFRNCWNTYPRLSRCSWNVLPITITSSRYTGHDLWGLSRWSPLTIQMSLERCRGQRAWLWTDTALDPLRTLSSTSSLDADPPANNCSSGPEWRGNWPQPACPEFCQSGAVGNSLSLWHHLVNCSLRRRTGPHSSSGWKQWGNTRDCLFDNPTSLHVLEHLAHIRLFCMWSFLGGWRIGQASTMPSNPMEILTTSFMTSSLKVCLAVLLNALLLPRRSCCLRPLSFMPLLRLGCTWHLFSNVCPLWVPHTLSLPGTWQPCPLCSAGMAQRSLGSG